jgi:uncharacterized membrane protein
MISVKLMELVTGADNSTLEPAYVWWAISIVVGLALEVYCVTAGKPFDLQAYGIGVGALMVGAGWSKRVGA